MAVFQSLMEGEEEGVVRAPQGDVSSGGGFRTTEHLSGESAPSVILEHQVVSS